MPRDHAQLRLAIWADDDFRALTGNAQHLYFILLTSPQLSYCGATDWRPAKLTGMVGDWTLETVLLAAAELIDQLYIVIDESTEEVLVRSFVRHDGLMKMPKMATAMATAHAAVGSAPLRHVVVWELQRLHREEPDLNGWKSPTAAALLEKASVDPSTYPCGNPAQNPSRNPPTYPSGNPSGNPKAEGSGNPPVSPYSLLLTPTPNSVLLEPSASDAEPPTLSVVTPEPKKPRRKPGRPLPDDFTITADMKAWSDGQDFLSADVVKQTERFKLWCLSKDQHYANWEQAWRNWMLKDFDDGKIRKRGGGINDGPARYEYEHNLKKRS